MFNLNPMRRFLSKEVPPSPDESFDDISSLTKYGDIAKLKDFLNYLNKFKLDYSNNIKIKIKVPHKYHIQPRIFPLLDSRLFGLSDPNVEILKARGMGDEEINERRKHNKILYEFINNKLIQGTSNKIDIIHRYDNVGNILIELKPNSGGKYKKRRRPTKRRRPSKRRRPTKRRRHTKRRR